MGPMQSMTNSASAFFLSSLGGHGMLGYNLGVVGRVVRVGGCVGEGIGLTKATARLANHTLGSRTRHSLG